jgi:hypothetical protein
VRAAAACWAAAIVIFDWRFPPTGIGAGVSGILLGLLILFLLAAPAAKPTLRVSLTDLDFRQLVAGQVVRKAPAGQPIEIALQDIGYERMLEHVVKATAGGVVKRIRFGRAP